ncbi:MAG TPA: diaminopimelate epimerase [Thermoanaerobaculia bacterium]|nr:diaminopimelate epimerase [Thermoanaerobaculia bacterium]
MTRFFKLSGCGNDFIALVEPAAPPTAPEIRAWCRRGLSLGADGVFALSRIEAGVEMRYWNSDGGPAALCLNGTRCAALLALHLGFCRERVTVRTGAGDLAARRLDDGTMAVEAPPPSAAGEITLRTADGEFQGWRVSVGVPHFVCFRDTTVEEVPLERWAPPLRRHRELGPEGANVDFVSVLSRRRLSIRSFERGIEGETLACGTGVLAAAAAGVAAGLVELPLRAHTRGGFPLDVLGAAAGGGIERWELAGDARLIAEGRLSSGAAEAPLDRPAKEAP